MPTVSDPDNEQGWLVQCTLSNITGDHRPPPSGITYATVPRDQAGELREFAIERVVITQSPDRRSQVVFFSFEVGAFSPGQREQAEEAARLALGCLQRAGVVAAGDLAQESIYRHP